MIRASQCLRSVLLASAFPLLAGHAWPLQAMTAAAVNSSDVERWVDSGMDEVRRLAAPVPQLLFSPPVWLTGEELRPFQERLSLDTKLTDLTHTPGIWNQAFAELLTTEGLLIIERPYEPVQGNYWLHYSYHEDKPWESFWKKPLPVPSVIRSTAFTRELLQEYGQLQWNATRRFCSSYWNSLSISHEDAI
ncbi:hypothetical protein [Prosthecobacter sp.]|jgi:hypothetical protein|uniref:hypothetical protein n=1 Tax=Prosthecobacter sp. TaxID=1965333 RepID=UPI0037CB9A8F